jgi:hypothetical protein
MMVPRAVALNRAAWNAVSSARRAKNNGRESRGREQFGSVFDSGIETGRGINRDRVCLSAASTIAL